jgi:hypothetical protein
MESRPSGRALVATARIAALLVSAQTRPDEIERKRAQAVSLTPNSSIALKNLMTNCQPTFLNVLKKKGRPLNAQKHPH